MNLKMHLKFWFILLFLNIFKSSLKGFIFFKLIYLFQMLIQLFAFVFHLLIAFELSLFVILIQ